MYSVFVALLSVFLILALCFSPEDTSTGQEGFRGTKMALPMSRGCFRLPSTFSFTRLFVSESITLTQSGKTRLPPSSPAAVVAAVRQYSSDRGGQKPYQKVVVVGIPNPFIWFRTRIYYFLIRAYFDKEFNIEEFTEGAKQVRENLVMKWLELLVSCSFNVIYLPAIKTPVHIVLALLRCCC